MSSVNNLSQQFRRQHQAAKHKTGVDKIFQSNLKKKIIKNNLDSFIVKNQEDVCNREEEEYR